LIQSLKISPGLSKLIDALFEQTSQVYANNMESKQRMKHTQIAVCSKRLDQIEQTMISTKNLTLHEKLENEWSQLHAEIEEMTTEVKQHKDSLHRAKELLNKVKVFFQDPYAIWQLGNSTMRELLLIVRFGGELYYSKKDGLRTSEKPMLSRVITEFNDQNTVSQAAGYRPQTF